MGGIFASIWELGRAVAKIFTRLFLAPLKMVEMLEKNWMIADLPNPGSCAIKKTEKVF